MGALRSHFLKLKKGPDAVLSVSRKKISEILSVGPFFHVLQIKCLLKCPCVKGTLMRI